MGILTLSENERAEIATLIRARLAMDDACYHTIEDFLGADIAITRWLQEHGEPLVRFGNSIYFINDDRGMVECLSLEDVVSVDIEP